MRIQEIKIHQLIGRPTNGSRPLPTNCIKASDTFRRGGLEVFPTAFFGQTSSALTMSVTLSQFKQSIFHDRGRHIQVWGGFENWVES